MEPIVVKRIGGGSIVLTAYNGVWGVVSGSHDKDLMGQDVVNIRLMSAKNLPFKIGDYIELFGEKFKLNALPMVKKVGLYQFDYNLQFEGVVYDLLKAAYLDMDDTGFAFGSAFSLMGDIKSFADLVINNMNRVTTPGTWTLGEYPTGTEHKSFEFQNATCLAALQEVCSVYEMEFYIRRTGAEHWVIDIMKNEKSLPFLFQYGRGKGLFSLERKPINNRSLITRLFAYGSNRNLGGEYRGGSPNLKLPANVIPSESLPYIQNNFGITNYGLFESAIVFDDIYPQRTGVVSSTFQAPANDPNAHLKFRDIGMPFNLNETQNGQTLYLLPSISAKVHFNTGNLAGYEFNIDHYDHNTKTFKINEYTDSRGAKFPSEDLSIFQIQPGDEYILLDINLPQNYISEAENRLLQKAKDYLNKNAAPPVTYDLVVDKAFVKSHGIVFRVGDYVKVKDVDLFLDGEIQIVGFSRSLLNYDDYSIRLSEHLVNRRMINWLIAPKL